MRPSGSKLELAGGNYRLAFVTGDAGLATWTRVTVEGARWSSRGSLEPGELRCPVLYLTHRGGITEILFGAEPASCRAVAALIVNKLP